MSDLIARCLEIRGKMIYYIQGYYCVSNDMKDKAIEINFGFGSTAPSFVFKTSIFGASFALFWALRSYFFGPLGLFLGSRSGSNTFLEPIDIDYQFLFWKYSPIFCFQFGKILGLLGIFWALRVCFWGWGQFQKLFGTSLHRLTTFILKV